jgi:hypothetical protein
MNAANPIVNDFGINQALLNTTFMGMISQAAQNLRATLAQLQGNTSLSPNQAYVLQYQVQEYSNTIATASSSSKELNSTTKGIISNFVL